GVAGRFWFSGNRRGRRKGDRGGGRGKAQCGEIVPGESAPGSGTYDSKRNSRHYTRRCRHLAVSRWSELLHHRYCGNSQEREDGGGHGKDQRPDGEKESPASRRGSPLVGCCGGCNEAGCRHWRILLGFRVLGAPSANH